MAAPPTPRLIPNRLQRLAPSRRIDARPQQFPTPRPLSEQEKLLVIYARSLQGSSTASAPIADDNVDHDLVIPPISIAAIKIEPLAPAEESGSEK
jgi:hypothetical protein